MKLNVETPDALVDITGLRELAAFDTSGDARARVRRARAHERRGRGPRLVRDYPALAESLLEAASQQLRNMATLGGNLLQRTRCAYFRGGEPFRLQQAAAGQSGCAAIGGLDRGHAVLGGSSECIAVYPGDWAVALVAFDAAGRYARPARRAHDRTRSAAS